MSISEGPLDPFEELTEVVEDTVEYFCDKERQSDELTWLMVQKLANSKLSELSPNAETRRFLNDWQQRKT